MVRVAMIGFGAVGASVLAHWGRLSADYELAALCVRPGQRAAARAAAPERTSILTDPSQLFDDACEVVIEVAGHAALLEVGEQLLASGRRLYTLSIGALADDAFADRLLMASAKGGGRLLLPAGALGGFDALLTLRECGLEAVQYISTKPPRAWKSTPAEEMVDLASLVEPVTFFRGSAREAATLFPKNANLAAAVALAGLGFEKTQVDLVANPAAQTNSARVNAHTPSAVLSICVESQAFAENPKSSSVVGASVIASLANATARLSFG